MRVFSRKALLVALSMSLSGLPLASQADLVFKKPIRSLAVSDAPATTPLPVASLSTTSLAFNAVDVGQSPYLTVRLTNAGEAALTLTAAPSLSGSSMYSAASNCTSSLAIGAFCDTSVTFNASAESSSESATLSFSTNVGTKTVSVTGSAVGHTNVALTTNPAGGSTDFGAVPFGSKGTIALKYTNSGTTAVTGLTVSPSSPLVVANNTCSSTLGIGENCTFNVEFTPSSASQTLSSTSVQVSASNATSSSLSFTGSTGPAAVALVSTTNAGSTSFGTVSYGSTGTISFKWTNNGALPVTVSAPTLSSTTNLSVTSNTCTGSVAAGANCTFNVVYTPANASDSLSSPTVTVPDATGANKQLTLSGSAQSGGTSIYTLTLNGANNDTSFYDSNGNLWTSQGGAKLSTTQAYSGATSATPGSTATAAFVGPSVSLPSTDFTVEGWVYLTASNTDALAFGQYYYGNSANTAWGFMMKGQVPYFCGIASVTGFFCVNGTSNIPLNTWTHIAASRQGTNLRVFIGGVLKSTGTVSGSMVGSSAVMSVGGYYASGAGSGQYKGFVDNVVVDKTQARYTANFTPN